MNEVTAKMTVPARIRSIEESGWSLAWDGCHKIYFLEDEERVREARASDYEIYPSAELSEIWEASCNLRMISRWGADLAHPWDVEQFEDEPRDDDWDEWEDDS